MTRSIETYFQDKLPLSAVQCLVHLEQQIEKQKFTAWSFASPRHQISAFWADECGQDPSHIQTLKQNSHPIFDLASLTKPLFLNLFFRMSLGPHFESWTSQKLSVLFKEKRDILFDWVKDKDWTIDAFLNHQTGFTPWAWMGYLQMAQKPEDALPFLMHHLLKNKFLTDSKETTYSDLNYFFLARLAESLFPETTWQEKLQSINLQLDAHFSHASLKTNKALSVIPYFPYGREKKSNSGFGAAHDTNANILAAHGIVSGHAGLFGSIADVVKGVAMLAQTQPKGHLPSGEGKTSRFLFGLDSKKANDGGGNFWLGHLGYTGTSFWFCPGAPDQLNFHVLLTNRTATRSLSCPVLPRVYVVTDGIQKTTKIYQKSQGVLTELDTKGFLALHKKTLLYWDDSVIRKAPDISESRSFVEQHLRNTSDDQKK